MKRTTAIYPNRIADKKRVEDKYKLNEFGNKDIKIYSHMNKVLIAEGYERVVYGDHGAYLEFTKVQIKWESFIVYRKDIGYYDTWYTENDKVKLYVQRVSVKDLPNPPPGKYSVNNNCKEGYADYKVGMCYISPDDISLTSDNPLFQEHLF